MRLTGKAVLFDFDGVIIDSEPVYERHWKEWAELHGVSLAHILSVHHGIPVVRTINIVAPHLDVEYESNQFQVKCATDLEGLVAHEGVRELLSTLPADRWAIATSSNRKIVMSQLAYLDLPHPEVLVTIEDVKQGKPAPDPYLLAAEKLGFSPGECVVIEDAPAGIESALGAGCKVIGVASTKQKNELEKAHRVIERFVDLDILVSNEFVRISLPG